MKVMGEMADGMTLAALSKLDLGLLEAAYALRFGGLPGEEEPTDVKMVSVEFLPAAWGGGADGKVEPRKAAAAATGKRPRGAAAATEPAGTDPGKVARKVMACKGCGADRRKAPWPKGGGAFCMACNRKRQAERWREKHGKKARPAVKAAGPVEKKESDAARLARIRAADERARKRVEDGACVDPKEFGL